MAWNFGKDAHAPTINVAAGDEQLLLFNVQVMRVLRDRSMVKVGAGKIPPSPGRQATPMSGTTFVTSYMKWNCLVKAGSNVMHHNDPSCLLFVE